MTRPKAKYRVTEVMLDCPKDGCDGYMCNVTGDMQFHDPNEQDVQPGQPIFCDECGFEDKMPRVKGFNE